MTSIRWMIGAALAVLVMPPALAQDGGPWSGAWETNQGRLHIEQDGDRARGDYDLKEGRVHGDVDGNVFRGVWRQSSAKRYCREERMDSHYWGRFTLRISDDGRHFQGRWWYCEDDPNDGGEWTGHRPHHKRDWH